MIFGETMRSGQLLLLLCAASLSVIPVLGGKRSRTGRHRHVQSTTTDPVFNGLTEDPVPSRSGGGRANNRSSSSNLGSRRHTALSSNDAESARVGSLPRSHPRGGRTGGGASPALAILFRNLSASSSSSGSQSSSGTGISRPRSTRPEFPLKESRDPILKSSKDALIITKKNYLKKDWCKTEPLIQKIREDGCLTRTIVNRFCYGQCNSFYIPKNAKQDMDLTAFKSCSFCKPKRYTWITITLRCPGLNPPFKRKKIQRVKQCRCISEILQ